MLRVMPLETREAPVAIDWVFTDPTLAPFQSLIMQAGNELAARIVTPLAPITQQYSAFGADGPLPAPQLPANTIRVYVGTHPQPGAIADGSPGGWSASPPLPRNWGGVIRFDTGQLWSYDVATTTRHELAHVFGAQHISDPGALMYAFQSPATRKDLTPSDFTHLQSLGWSVAGVPVLPDWRPFPGFTGEVRVVSGDATGDGIPDLVAAAGPGGGPHVKVMDGRTGVEVASFFAYDAGFTGGVNAAAGNGLLLTGAGAGGAPHVKVYQSLNQVGEFYAAAPTVTSGVTVAVQGTRIVTQVGGLIHTWV